MTLADTTVAVAVAVIVVVLLAVCGHQSSFCLLCVAMVVDVVVMRVCC